MFPSSESPYYGTFVASAYRAWLLLFHDGDSRKCVIDKQEKTTLKKIVSYFCLYCSCIKDVLLRKPDLIEIHYPFFFIPLFFLVKRKNLVLRFHGSDLEKLLGSRLMQRLFFINEKKIVCLVAPSGYYKKRLVSELGYRGKVVVVNPDSVDSVFYPSDAANSKPAGFLKIGIVGRLDKDKNIQEVIRALPLLNGFDYSLTIAGGGSYEAQLKALAKELKVDSAVEFTGPVAREELVKVIQEFSIFVFSSTRTAESFGLVGLEALACGIPVVYRDTLQGPLEYLNERNSLSYASSENDLASVISLYQSFSVAQKSQMRQAALDTAENFTFESTVFAGVERIFAVVKEEQLKI